MPVLDEAETVTSSPSVKLRKVGQKVGLAVYDITKDQDTNMDGTPKLFSNGKPAERVIVSGVVVGGDGVTVDDGEDQTVTEGQEVTVWLTGAKWYQYNEARKVCPPIQTGSIMTVEFASEEPSSTAGYSPKHVWSVTWRDGDDADLSAKCEALFTAKHATVLDEAPANEGLGNGEKPF